MLRMKRQNVTHSEAEVQKSTKIPSLKGMITFFVAYIAKCKPMLRMKIEVQKPTPYLHRT